MSSYEIGCRDLPENKIQNGALKPGADCAAPDFLADFRGEEKKGKWKGSEDGTEEEKDRKGVREERDGERGEVNGEYIEFNAPLHRIKVISEAEKRGGHKSIRLERAVSRVF